MTTKTFVLCNVIVSYLCLMKNECSSMESSKTCESVRDKRRALSKHANISSWNTSSRRYRPRSSRRFM